MVDPDTLRRLPKVGDVLDSDSGRGWVARAPRWAVVEAVRAEIARLREGLQAGAQATAIDPARIEAEIAFRIRPSLRHVVNASGVVLHTNLGRAPLAQLAIDRMVEVARGYSNLEYRLDERGRGSRHEHVASLLRDLTSAEDALVVNNCAAAVLVALNALAHDGTVVVSRGELVEIGGGFRVPDVMRASGARLCEVGTTNRTRLADYAQVLDEAADVRMLMKVHRSNFAIVGFTEDTSVEELATLAGARCLPLFVDLGAGALAELPGLGGSPTVQSLIAAGADLVAFSGDKLLGGPQAGVLVGRSELIARIARHPLMRAMRPDKLSLAALEGTLALYRADRSAEIPVIAMLTVPEPTLEARARTLAAGLEQARPEARFTVVRVRSAVGGGAMPGVEPWSWAVAAEVPGHGEEALDAALRAGDPAIVGRIENGRVLLDVRTIMDGTNEHITAAFAHLPGALP